MSKADAAQCWAAIEQQLAGTALPDERIDAVRAACIRIIGDAIGGMTPAPSSRRRGGQRARKVYSFHPSNKAGLGNETPAKPGKTADKQARRRGGQRAGRDTTPPSNKARLGSLPAKPGKTALKLDDTMPPIDRTPLSYWKNHALPVSQARRSAPDETVITSMLSTYLDRACGYSQDDEVDYR